MTTSVNRNDLAAIQGASPKVIRFFEDIFATGQSNTETIDGVVQGTQSIQDATNLTLSPNAALNNERIFTPDPNFFSTTDNGPGGTFLLGLLYGIVLNGGFACTFNLEADTNLDLPSSGRLLTDDVVFPGPYADDAAAATAGVPVNGAYRKNGGSVAWRVS